MFQPSIWRREEHQDSKVTRSSDNYVHVTDLLSSSREDVTYAESRRHDPCPEEENLFYWFMANTMILLVCLFVWPTYCVEGTLRKLVLILGAVSPKVRLTAPVFQVRKQRTRMQRAFAGGFI